MQSAAPVHALADEPGFRAREDTAAWLRFAAASDDAEVFSSWLVLLASRLQRARAALLLTSDGAGGAYRVAAAWPDPQRDLQYLAPVAQRSLTERRGLALSPTGEAPGPDGSAHVAYPIEAGGRLHGTVVFEIGPGPNADLQATLRRVHWASAWLVAHFQRQALAAAEAESARVATLNDLMASALQQRRLTASALAVANELAAALRCDRVSIGFEDADRITPLAMSHTATFDPRSDHVRAVAEAMDEVLDLGTAIAVPRPPGDEPGAIAHLQAATQLNAAALLSVPLVDQGRTIGVITCERQQALPFDVDAQRIAAAAGLMLGPVWALQRAGERSVLQRLREHGRDALQAVFGPRHPGLKLVTAIVALTLLGLGLWQAEHRVAARTTIEGSTQLSMVAPFDGFVAAGLVRAGDTVRHGQLLARLDDRDLKLERTRWAAERDQLQRRYQMALAQGDRGAMGVTAAQSHQAEAQLELAEDKLARTQLVAPFDGVVVAGDLSQSIGTPVEQGRMLFEVAPLEGYRVVLQVDDRDIARLAVGQRGELLLSSLPDRALPFTVSSITSVATQRDGRNVFRVEARIDGAPARLRPGMEGVGKVVVGERSLLWIWTHGFVDWLRLSLWTWMP